MDKHILQKINRALENSKENELEPDRTEAYRKRLHRLTEELDWEEAGPERGFCVKLLSDVMTKIRSAGIVATPGSGYFNNSYLLYLVKVTEVNPVEWDLPFSIFCESFGPDNDFVIVTGTGGIAVVENVLTRRKEVKLGYEVIAEIEPGSFHITFIVPETTYQLHIIEDKGLDRFKRTLKGGWRPLTKKVLYKFNLGLTDGSVWFETDKMRGWLSEFEPESMSDLCLLRALFSTRRMHLYKEILRRKQNPDSIPSTGDARVDRILQETYGTLVYREQAHLLQKMGATVPEHDYILALKGEEIARTMQAVEALWPKHR